MKDAVTSSTNGTVSLLGRSLGHAARFMRELLPRRRAGDQARGADAASPALRENERMRRRLAADIAQLETEIDRLHSMVTSNVVPERGPKASLNELLDQSRQKRELLHEKRQELSRVERHIARERRLSPLETPEAKLRPTKATSSTQARRRVARAPVAKGPLRAAVAKAIESASFGTRGQRLAFQRIAERLLDSDPEVRREAVVKLSRFGGPDIPELLLSSVDDSSERVRLAALNALVGSSHGASAEAFRRYLHDPNPALRLSALRGLASLNPRLMPSSDLIARLEDSDASIRRTSANILGWRRSHPISPELIHALALTLHDDDEGVRAAAAEALGNLGDHRGVLPLINALADPSAPVSEAAERALGAVLGEQVDAIGKGMPSVTRAAALKDWWKDARADVYLAAHTAELPLGSAERAPPAAPPPPKRRAAAPVAEEPTRAAKPAAAPEAVKPAPAPAKQEPAKEEAAPDVAAIAEEPTAEPAAAAEGTAESGEEFENMFAGGEGEGAADPGEISEEDAGQEEAGEQGGFEEIFGEEEK